MVWAKEYSGSARVSTCQIVVQKRLRGFSSAIFGLFTCLLKYSEVSLQHTV